MNTILLDTNAYSSLMCGDEQILEVISSAETIYISIFVMGELYSGFKGGKKETENIDRLKQFLSKTGVKILNATSETAEVFAFVKNELRLKGRPIPINDVWIAAHAIESGSFLISNDQHFSQIDGIRVFP